MRIFLERMLVGPSGFSTVGVPLRVGGEDRLLFAKLTNFIADGDGHRMCWDWRGAGSLKPCFKHWNVCKKNSGLTDRTPNRVEIKCSELNKFRTWSPADLFQTADALVEVGKQVVDGTRSRATLTEMEKSLGLNCNSLGLLMSPTLRFQSDTHTCVSASFPRHITKMFAS